MEPLDQDRLTRLLERIGGERRYLATKLEARPKQEQQTRFIEFCREYFEQRSLTRGQVKRLAQGRLWRAISIWIPSHKLAGLAAVTIGTICLAGLWICSKAGSGLAWLSGMGKDRAKGSAIAQTMTKGSGLRPLPEPAPSLPPVLTSSRTAAHTSFPSRPSPNGLAISPLTKTAPVPKALGMQAKEGQIVERAAANQLGNELVERIIPVYLVEPDSQQRLWLEKYLGKDKALEGDVVGPLWYCLGPGRAVSLIIGDVEFEVRFEKALSSKLTNLVEFSELSLDGTGLRADLVYQIDPSDPSQLFSYLCQGKAVRAVWIGPQGVLTLLLQPGAKGSEVENGISGVPARKNVTDNP